MTPEQIEIGEKRLFKGILVEITGGPIDGGRGDYLYEIDNQSFQQEKDLTTIENQINSWLEIEKLKRQLKEAQAERDALQKRVDRALELLQKGYGIDITEAIKILTREGENA